MEETRPHGHLQTFAKHNQLVEMKGTHSGRTSGHEMVGGGAGSSGGGGGETEDLMLAGGKLLKSVGCSRLFAH